jgi:transketolase
MRNAFISALVDAALADPTVWLLNADLGFSVLEPFAERFPDRYLNVGVAEQNMVGIAAGLALSGFKPFIYSIANFPTQRCLEQIRVDVCYHDAPVTVVAVGGGFAYGSQGYTHHAIEDLAVMRALPGMRVVAPSDPVETVAFVHEFVRNPGPSYLRLGRGGEPTLHEKSFSKAPTGPVRMREGNTVVLVSTGAVLAQVLAAADHLSDEGIDARVISLPMLKPLDEAALLTEILGAQLIVTIEEHSLIGGLRDTVAPLLASRANSPRMMAFGVIDGISKGIILDQLGMLRHCGLDAPHLYSNIKAALLSNVNS